MTTLEAGPRGHVGAAFSLVEILRVLYDDVLRYDARNPRWSGRDRFVLSKGHGCLALYAVLADKGFFPESELSKFCKSDGMLGGHPEHHIPGVEASTGSLGHGMSIALGFALNARCDRAPHRTFVVIGDGGQRGSIWEAALSAASTISAVSRCHRPTAPVVAACDVQNLGHWPISGGLPAPVDQWARVAALREVLTNLPRIRANRPPSSATR